MKKIEIIVLLLSKGNVLLTLTSDVKWVFPRDWLTETEELSEAVVRIILNQTNINCIAGKIHKKQEGEDYIKYYFEASILMENKFLPNNYATDIKWIPFKPEELNQY